MIQETNFTLSFRVNLWGGTELCSTAVGRGWDGIVRRTRPCFFYLFVFQGTLFKDDQSRMTIHHFIRTFITQPWHSSACRHSPPEDVTISGIKTWHPAPSVPLPALLFFVNQHNEADFISPYFLVNFYLKYFFFILPLPPTQNSRNIWQYL